MSRQPGASSRLDAEAVFERIERRVDRGLDRLAIWTGAAMVVMGLAHIAITREFSFSLTTMVWGSLIITGGLVLASRTNARLVELAQAIVELDRQRAWIEHRADAVDRLLDGQPRPDLSPAHLAVLVGDPAAASAARAGTETTASADIT